MNLRTASVFLALLLSAESNAQSANCRIYEDAVLRAMSVARLTGLYCDYARTATKARAGAEENMRLQTLDIGERHVATLQACAQEIKRIMFALETQYKAKPPATCDGLK